MVQFDSLIQKYLQGLASEEEKQQLFQWIQQSPENRKSFFEEKDIVDVLNYYKNSKDYNPDAELNYLKQRLIQKKPGREINFKQLIRIAAVLLIAFGLGWSGHLFLSTTNQSSNVENTQEIIVPNGQVNQIFLADGTRIWVNSGTQLTVPTIFTGKKRIVKLKGEAFFHVAKDKNHPFIVELNGQQIEVLGTSFNVRAYENSNEIETTLESGQIRLRTGNQTTLIKPGEQAIYNRSGGKLIVGKVNPQSFSSWKEGRYEFIDEDLLEVFEVVERWYDVEITADPAYFDKMHFSGVIKRNKDVRHFLELLDLTIPIKYDIASDKISITPKE